MASASERSLRAASMEMVSVLPSAARASGEVMVAAGAGVVTEAAAWAAPDVVSSAISILSHVLNSQCLNAHIMTNISWYMFLVDAYVWLDALRQSCEDGLYVTFD